MKLKTILFICCLMSVANVANACGGIKQSDGSWHIKYNFTRNVDGKTYLCCVHTTRYSKNENCKTKEEWIAYLERDVGEISYMNDMQTREQFDRHSSRHFNFEDRGLKGFLKKIF